MILVEYLERLAAKLWVLPVLIVSGLATIGLPFLPLDRYTGFDSGFTYDVVDRQSDSMNLRLSAEAYLESSITLYFRSLQPQPPSIEVIGDYASWVEASRPEQPKGGLWQSTVHASTTTNDKSWRFEWRPEPMYLVVKPRDCTVENWIVDRQGSSDSPSHQWRRLIAGILRGAMMVIACLGVAWWIFWRWWGQRNAVKEAATAKSFATNDCVAGFLKGVKPPDDQEALRLILLGSQLEEEVLARFSIPPRRWRLSCVRLALRIERHIKRLQPFLNQLDDGRTDKGTRKTG